MMEQDVNLAEYAFFKGMDPQLLGELAKSAEIQSFEEKQPLFRTGDRANRMLIVQSGKIELFTEKLEHPEDREPIPTPIRAVERGEILGWSCMVPPYEWRFDAAATEKSTAIAVDGNALRALCEKHPAFGYEVFKRLTPIIVDRLYAAKFQLSMHSGKPYSHAEGA